MLSLLNSSSEPLDYNSIEPKKEEEIMGWHRNQHKWANMKPTSSDLFFFILSQSNMILRRVLQCTVQSKMCDAPIGAAEPIFCPHSENVVKWSWKCG